MDGAYLHGYIVPFLVRTTQPDDTVWLSSTRCIHNIPKQFMAEPLQR